MQIISKDWEKTWAEKIGNNGGINSSDYWNRRAEDYNDYIRTSNYEHGRKIREVFEKEGILDKGFEILDIAAGPGSISIPFAEEVKRVVAVEPAEEMCKYLGENMKEKGLENIEIINCRWEDLEGRKYENRFDLVLCAHALWHFPDIVTQLAKMEKISRRFCCIAESIKNLNNYHTMYEKLGLDTGDIDHSIYIYNILYRMNIPAHVKVIDISMRRSVNSGIRMWELLVGKYRKLTETDRKIIREHVLNNSIEGIYERKSKMAVIWWEAESG